MPIVETDLTTAGQVPSGTHTATIAKLDYQIKTGEKWNKDGTTTTDFTTWVSTPAERKRLRYGMFVEGSGYISREFYMTDKALGFLKEFLTKCGCSVSKAGFDPEEPLKRQIGITVSTKQDPGQEPRQEISGFHKV